MVGALKTLTKYTEITKEEKTLKMFIGPDIKRSLRSRIGSWPEKWIRTLE